EGAPPGPEMAQGRGVRGRPMVEDGGRDTSRRGGFTVARERVPALRLRPVGPAVADQVCHRRHDRRALRRRARRGIPAPPRCRTLPPRTRGTPGEVRPGLAPREDATDRVRAVRRRKPTEAWGQQAGDVHVPGLHPHLWSEALERGLHREAEDGGQAATSQAAGGEGDAAPAASRTDRGSWEVAAERDEGETQLICCIRQARSRY